MSERRRKIEVEEGTISLILNNHLYLLYGDKENKCSLVRPYTEELKVDENILGDEMKNIDFLAKIKSIDSILLLLLLHQNIQEQVLTCFSHLFSCE